MLDLFNALPEMILLLDDQFRVTWFDRLMRHSFGWKRKKTLGKPLDQLYPFSEVDLPLGRDGNAPICLHMRSGAIRCFHVELISYRNKQKIVRLSEPGQQLKPETQQREFVANASHELRTPLAILGGYLEQISVDDHATVWSRPLEVMTLQKERMQQIIDDMLQLSGLEQAGERVRQETVDVPELLDECLQTHAILAKKRDQKLTLKLDRQLLLRGSTQMLRSAFSNLIINAVKYTQKGGAITVRWEQDGAVAQLSVQDNGPGIPKAAQKRLTERFYRVDKGRSREMGGTGLGLSIVQGVLQAHGTLLEIESGKGSGSCFYAQFPANLLLSRG